MTKSWRPPNGWSKLAVPKDCAGFTALFFLQQQFARVPARVWSQRFIRQQVRDASGRALRPNENLSGISLIFYSRHPEAEPVIPFDAQVLYRDEHLLLADKPHFLPVAPSGQYVEQTLLSRLREQLILPDLVPLHRLDKDTAGLVLFAVNPTSRNIYHQLFRCQQMHKVYDAVARFDERFIHPYSYRSRLVEGGERFFTMKQVPSIPNSFTKLQVLQQDKQGWALYRLEPTSGKKHQLRVHMTALGVPIRFDPFYPYINDPVEGDFSQPLQLLARELAFVDPITGQAKHFYSQRQLQWPTQI